MVDWVADLSDGELWQRLLAVRVRADDVARLVEGRDDPVFGDRIRDLLEGGR